MGAGNLLTFAMVLLASAAAAPVTGPAPGGSPVAGQELGGHWDLLLDPDDLGRSEGWDRGDSKAWRYPLRIAVPGVLESLPSTVDYDGVVWYRRELPAAPAPPAGAGRVFLTFESVNYRADAWLGQRHLGRHDGSDAPFRFDVTGLLQRPGQWLVVRCVDPGRRQADGLLLGALPHAKESWYYNYGGITGAVRIETVPMLELRGHEVLPGDGGDALLVLDLVNHHAAERTVNVSAFLSAGARSSLAQQRPQRLPPGASRVQMPLPESAELARWSPEKPVLHPVSVLVVDEGVAHTWPLRVGLRTFDVQAGRFVLDGEPVYLKGVLYQPYYPRGLARPPDPGFLRRDLEAVRRAGFNLLRVHLRCQPEIYQLCDEIGLFVQAEPTLGWITLKRPETVAAVDASLVALAQAVAGHPSVVMVGLLNELSGLLYRDSEALLARAAALMPERLVLDDSGSWQGTARYRRPGSDTPVEYDDLHVYRAWPWTEEDALTVRTLGADHDRLVYVSEYGFGGIPSFGANLSGFGSALHLPDARDYAADLGNVLASLRDTPLGSLAPDARSVSRLGQANQARAARFMASALRANPRVAGDCYTQWRDAAWENGAGLCDVWGDPKPALAVFAELNALRTRPADPFAVPRPELPERPTLPVATGSMVALEPEVEAVLAALISHDPVDAERLPRLAVVGFRPRPWGPENQALTVALLRFARDGGTLLMLQPPDAGRPLPQIFFGYEGSGQVADLPFSLHARPSRGHFIGIHHVLRPGSSLLDDLPGMGPLLDERFAVIAPHKVLHAGDRTDVRAELLSVDGWGGYLGSAVQVVPYGEGHVVLSTLRLGSEQMEDPLARRVVENLVRLAADLAAQHEGESPSVVARPIPPELAEKIGRSVWRHKIYFGLAERLALQAFNGTRARRSELDDLDAIVKRKNLGLDLVIAGNAEEGLQALARIDRRALEGDREAFLRLEIELSQLFYGPDGADAASTVLPDHLRVSELYLRALRLMRSGFPDAAMNQLRRARDMVAGWRRERATPPGGR